MTYVWHLKEQNGQHSIGFHEIYVAEDNTESYLALINYLPQLESSNNEKIAHVTLFIAGDKQKMTDGRFHWIHDDIGVLITVDMIPVQAYQSAVIWCTLS